MGLSFLSLLYLQVSYIEEMVKMRKEQFEENVGRSLAQAVHNLELVETKSIWKRCGCNRTCGTYFRSVSSTDIG